MQLPEKEKDTARFTQPLETLDTKNPGLLSWFTDLDIPGKEARVYSSTLVSNGFDTVDSLQDTNATELENDFGLKRGHARRIMRCAVKNI